jgi:hypothetical protein
LAENVGGRLDEASPGELLPLPSVGGIPGLQGLPDLPGLPRDPIDGGLLPGGAVLTPPLDSLAGRTTAPGGSPPTAHRGAPGDGAGTHHAHPRTDGSSIGDAVACTRTAVSPAVAQRTVPFARPAHTPLPGPGGDPTGALGQASLIDAGAQRFVELHAAALGVRAPLRLMAGGMAASFMPPTRDRLREIPEFPG